LFLSAQTVKWHLATVYRRLGARNRAHAVALWAGGNTRPEIARVLLTRGHQLEVAV
jgi:hypothetical protein